MDWIHTLNGYEIFAYSVIFSFWFWLLGVWITKIIPETLVGFVKAWGRVWKGDELKSYEKYDLWGLPVMLIFAAVIISMVVGNSLHIKQVKSETATSTVEQL